MLLPIAMHYLEKGYFDKASVKRHNFEPREAGVFFLDYPLLPNIFHMDRLGGERLAQIRE